MPCREPSDLGLFILGPNHEAIPVKDMIEWAKSFEKSTRIVKQTGNRTVYVSTVFLGLDHGWGGPPLLFETMVFGGKHSDQQDRYSTWAEAERGHRRWVKRVFKHRPRRHGEAIHGDFTTPKKTDRARKRRANLMEGMKRWTALSQEPETPSPKASTSDLSSPATNGSNGESTTLTLAKLLRYSGPEFIRTPAPTSFGPTGAESSDSDRKTKP